MNTKPLAPSGHLPTLIASFLHFDLSFAIWVLLGALAVSIAEQLGLNAAQKGLLVATPVLSGSLLRIPMGLLGDRYGGKRVGAAMLVLLFVPLAIGWQAGDSLSALLAVGLMLGAAGASFAVALPLASRWYPPERQGLAMGVAAAGNSGSVIANLAAPQLAALVGWHNVLGLAMLPLALVLVAFLMMAKDSPQRGGVPSVGQYMATVRNSDLWWFCLLYSVTFGGYVGLSSFLPILFRDQYGVSPITAGYLNALGAFVGSGLRPVGGYLADRVGGVRMLSVLLVGIGGVYALAAQMPELPVMVGLLVVGMAFLGMGNGSVFQLVPQRFQSQIGIATGVVGAVGGLGGFVLPTDVLADSRRRRPPAGLEAGDALAEDCTSAPRTHDPSALPVASWHDGRVTPFVRRWKIASWRFATRRRRL
ncbi:MAG: NarK/NasA family nitrate transporter [Chloroflexi bacterium]|nr:NarK/NasA family nitrate transporter [Chloroflexota bacterium]